MSEQSSSFARRRGSAGAMALLESLRSQPLVESPSDIKENDGASPRPPTPPPDFNPPADASIEETLSGVSSPPSSVPSGVPSRSSYTGAPSPLNASIETVRPALQALQRVSHDSAVTMSTNSSLSSVSVPSVPSGGPDIGSPGSAGSEVHLMEARERLLMEGTSAISSGVSSRRGSEEDLESAIDIHMTAPTPPPGESPSGSRRGSGSGSIPIPHDLPPEHAWDSVWPAPNAPHRHSLPEAGPSRFPTAPVSPFVTPAFSPAILSTTSRRPSSPKLAPLPQPPRSRSPSFLRASSSPRPGASPVLEAQDALWPSGRRRSITEHDFSLSHSPTKSQPIGITKHQRSQSGTISGSSPTQRSFAQTMEKLRGKSPDASSPPRSPRRAATANLPLVERPASPIGSRFHRRSTGHTKLTESASPTSPRSAESARVLEPLFSSIVAGNEEQRASPRAVAVDKSLLRVSEELAELPSASIPPVALPPPVSISPIPADPPPLSLGRDDGMPALGSAGMTLAGPLFQPVARPSGLRRSLSDFESKSRSKSPGLSRSLSIQSEEKGAKRPSAIADLPSPASPAPGVDNDMARVRKSPKFTPAPTLEPISTPPAPGPSSPDSPTKVLPDHLGKVDLVDEGDVLPDMDSQMDVTFEDEGLNTLERIFLLSKSDFAFHRAYIARVLGDLLYDVDPCESVEYVLPLISSFTVDDDESVKESFAGEFHRILWYFFSTCLVTPADADAGPDETVTITSDGLNIVPTPTAEEQAADKQPAPKAMSLGPSSAGSSLTQPGSYGSSLLERDAETQTPDSIFSNSSQETAASPSQLGQPFAGVDAEKGKDVGPLEPLPNLGVDFFTPLLGAMLLSPNPDIQEQTRATIVSVISRLRGKGDMSVERWGQRGLAKVQERRTYANQEGPHSHDLTPLSDAQRKMIEMELINGIVIGMGHLSTEMPAHLFADTKEAGQQALNDYARTHRDGEDEADGMEVDEEMAAQKEAFQTQLWQEAAAGRATSMNLIGALCEVYQGQELVDVGFIDEVLRSGDGDLAVRAEGALAMSMTAKTVPVEHIYRMIPLFEQLAADEAVQVRSSACLSLPSLARRIESKDYRRTFAVKSVETLTDGAIGVRCAVLEALGELIHVFHEDSRGPPIELLKIYLDEEDWGGGLGQDWEVIASFNLPGIALTLGSSRWSELRPLYARLNTSTHPQVRRTLAASLHEFAKILDPTQVAEDLMPVYHKCLPIDDAIRELVFEHVDVLFQRLPLALAWETFLDLASAWQSNSLGGWRAREQLALHIPTFFETFHDLPDVEVVLDMMRDALLDPFAAVRDAATKGIPASYTILDRNNEIARKFRETLLDLGTSEKFKQRVTFVRCLREFIKPPPNRQSFEDFFLPALPRLSQDVVDVRLGLAQTIADLFVVGAFYGDRVKVPKEILVLAEALAGDDAVDVRDTVRKVDLRTLHKGEEIPYQIETPEKPFRAAVPDLGPAPAPAASPMLPSPSPSIATDTPRRGPLLRQPSSEVASALSAIRLSTYSPHYSPRLPHESPSTHSWRSSPSPSLVGPQDPFALSFAEATPSESSSSSRE